MQVLFRARPEPVTPSASPAAPSDLLTPFRPPPVRRGSHLSRDAHPRGAAVLAAEDFQTFLDKELACHARHGRPFSLIHVETRGQGSDVMAGFVRQAGAWLRATDLIGRIGSEKATILLPFTGREQAEEVAEFLLHTPQGTQEGLVHHVECVGLEAPRELLPELAFDEAPPVPAPVELPPGVRWEPRGVPLLLGTELPRGKRLMDIVLALAGLAVLWPLMALIGLVIWTTSGRPILFKQWRTGKGFRRFQIYKFRTMRPSPEGSWKSVEHLNEMDGPLFKSEKDPRILRFGKFLRKTSMDELPQLVNVLKGDMTLVGPRALSPLPSQYQTWQLRRFDVTPGVACEWQAMRRSDTDFVAWMRSDLRYVDLGTTFTGDAGLLLRILKAVLRCAGGR